MARILVVDDDAPARREMAAGLRRPHRVVATAADGEEALFLASSFAPQLVITDVRMPRMTGWELVQQLRAHPDTRFASVLFVTELDVSADRVRALRLGAVDFLAKPFAIEELELRVENALHGAAVARRVSERPAASGFAGNLETLPLPSLLGMLAADRKSGELRVALAGEEVRLLLRDGAIVQARFVHGGGLLGFDCVMHVMDWDEGRFGFIEHPVLVNDEIGASTTSLLMEAARRQDEAARDRAGVG